MNAIIVDVQGFKSDENEFILKEIAIHSNSHILTFLIKPPCPFYDLTKTERRKVCWIERNRGIHWNEGYIPYSNHKYIIQKILQGKIIFVKGVEKRLWLMQLLENSTIYNLEDKDCPSLLKLHEKYAEKKVYSCYYHSNICALKNVLYLSKWCLENKPLF